MNFYNLLQQCVGPLKKYKNPRKKNAVIQKYYAMICDILQYYASSLNIYTSCSPSGGYVCPKAM